MALPEYLDSGQLERLKEHKYKSQGTSILEVRPEAVAQGGQLEVTLLVAVC